MLPTKALYIIFGTIGISGLGTAITLPILLTRGGQKIALKWPQDYKRDCYKLLIDKGTGELVTCYRTIKGRQEASLLFYLWWTKDEQNARFFEITKLTVESNSQMSFEFKRGGQNSDKKLNTKGKDFSKLSGQLLSSLNCKIDDGIKNLSCSSGTLELAEPRSITFYF